MRVDEPDSSGNLGTAGSPNQATAYSYDARGNLAAVVQGSQRRGFVYDSLGRLSSASNPENRPSLTSASLTYTYDANSNLTGRRDARGVITSYDYDDLDRVTEGHYTGGPSEARSTSRVEYDYDSCGANATYTKGRPCSVTAYDSSGNEFSKTAYTGYDALGRVRGSIQTTDTQSYTMSYEYDRSGNLTSQTYPSGKVVETAYDGAGRIAGVRRVEAGGSLSYYAGADGGTNAIGYAPHGGMREVLLGNGLWEQRRYNSRLQPTQIGLGTGKTAVGTGLGTTDSGLLLLDYAYGTSANNGNVASQRIRSGTLNLTQSYTYDSLNRLKTAGESGGGTAWSQAYSYDRYGNRAVMGPGGYLPSQALTPQSLSVFDTATNRLDGMNGMNTVTVAYDGAGNLTRDWGGRRFTYDGENRMVSFDTTGTDGDATYYYDGDGRRVKKAVGGTGGPVTIYVYNVAGQLVAEYATRWRPLSGTQYLTQDHLGSTRAVTGPDGAAVSRHDYLPFGEEIEASRGNRSSVSGYTADLTDGPAQKFTGKERDAESGLDYFQARYFSGAGGRFSSADRVNVTWKRLVDPGNTLNKYSYAANNPLLYVDPDGEDVTVFFRAPSVSSDKPFDFGHVMIAVVNQDTRKVKFLDYNPSKGSWKAFPVHLPTSDRLRKHAMLTIRTTPEEAQKMIDYINRLEMEQVHNQYNLMDSNCVHQCARAMGAGGIYIQYERFFGLLPMTPWMLWEQLYRVHAREKFQGGIVTAAPGLEYGARLSYFSEGTPYVYNLIYLDTSVSLKVQ